MVLGRTCGDPFTVNPPAPVDDDTKLAGRCEMVGCPPAAGVPFGPDIADDGRSVARSPFETVGVAGLRSDGLLEDDSVVGCGIRVGVDRLVERLMISFPCTTRLSVDFLRSLVSIWSTRRFQSG